MFSFSFISKLRDHLKQAHGKVIEEEVTFSGNQGMQQICFIYNIWVCSVIIIQCNITPYLKYIMFFVNCQLLICSILSYNASNKIKIIYTKTHYGHECSLGYLPIPKQLR